MLRNQKQLRTEKELNADGSPKAAVEMLELDIAPVAEEKTVVVAINRVTKVVKGGKRFSFNALVVVGDSAGSVGVALGKSNEVQVAIQKATAGARKEMITFPLKGSTIPHETEGYFGAGHVWMKPAVGGTGLIAGGVKNVLTKNLGSRNSFNTVYATLNALKQLRSREDVLKMRGDK